MRKTRLAATDPRVASKDEVPSSDFPRSLKRLLLCLLLLFLTLLFPGHPKQFTFATFAQLPLELPVIVILLVLMKPHTARYFSITLVLIIGLLLLLRLTDLGFYLAFNRPFNPLLEMHLLADGWNLASTSVGRLEASIVALITLLALVAMARLLYRCLRTISQVNGVTRTLTLWLSGLTLLGATSLLIVNHQSNRLGSVHARLIPEFSQRITHLRQSMNDQRAFLAELQSDFVLDHNQPTFSALAQRDVILIFVESYGRGYLDSDRFSETARKQLTAAEHRLTAAGLHAKSGWLGSPVRGGRSWLAQATLQSGLEINNQARFDRLVSSDRLSISALFQQAGWRTAGVMPAIQFAWPEGSWYHYEELETSQEMNYAGKRFGYVTMPDQYTLSRFEKHIRHTSEQPVMATLALISTHAPWTPLPRKIDWDLVGNGSVYDGTHRFGEPINWKFRTKVQDMYEQSFDYTLDVVADYISRYAEQALFIIVGDHQPPPIINGWGKSADVPIHMISRDSSLLDRLADTQWASGLLPTDSISSQRMSEFRRLLATQFE